MQSNKPTQIKKKEKKIKWNVLYLKDNIVLLNKIQPEQQLKDKAYY